MVNVGEVDINQSDTRTINRRKALIRLFSIILAESLHHVAQGAARCRQGSIEGHSQ
jgi:hypothetical protein